MVFHLEDLYVLLEIVLNEVFVLVCLHCSFIGGKCVIEKKNQFFTLTLT
jgi:hypothetical protein